MTGLGKVPAVQDPQSTQDRDLLGSCDWGRPSGEVLQAPVREAVTDLVGLVDAVLADGRPGVAGRRQPRR